MSRSPSSSGDGGRTATEVILRPRLKLQEQPSLFPLAVVPFEHYFLADDRADYPMCPFIRLTFAGRLERRRFTEAVRAALGRHPLLRAYLHGPIDGKTSELSWRDAGDREPFLDWDAEGMPLAFPGGQGIDLRSEIGIRLWIREGNEKTYLWLQFHHACCDALGFMNFVEDLLQNYHPSFQELPGRAEEDGLREQFLRQRGRMRRPWRQWLMRTVLGLRRIAAFYATKPCPIVAPPREEMGGDESVSLPAFHSHFFSAEDLQRLLRQARQAGSTLNDLLLRDLFLSLRDWVQTTAPQPRGSTLRIGIAQNLREVADRAMPAANCVSMVFLDRDLRHSLDPMDLLDGIRRETEQIKHWGLGLAMILVVNWRSHLRGGMVRLVPPDRCLSSTVLSNLGALLEDCPLPRQGACILAGDVRLESIEPIPAIRPKTNVIFNAATYANQLNVCMGYDHRLFHATESRRLFQSFVHRVQMSAERGSPSCAVSH